MLLFGAFSTRYLSVWETSRRGQSERFKTKLSGSWLILQVPEESMQVFSSLLGKAKVSRVMETFYVLSWLKKGINGKQHIIWMAEVLSR